MGSLCHPLEQRRVPSREPGNATSAVVDTPRILFHTATSMGDGISLAWPHRQKRARETEASIRSRGIASGQQCEIGPIDKLGARRAPFHCGTSARPGVRTETVLRAQGLDQNLDPSPVRQSSAPTPPCRRGPREIESRRTPERREGQHFSGARA